MNQTKGKMVPGGRIFGNALASIKTPSQLQKPIHLGLEKINDPEITSLESSHCLPENNRVPLPVKRLPKLLPDSHTLLSMTDASRENQRFLHSATTKENDNFRLQRQQRPPPGFHSVFSPLDAEVHSATQSIVPAHYAMDSYGQVLPGSVSYYSLDPSSLRNYFPTSMDYSNTSSHVSSLTTSQSSPPDPHEALLKSLYSMTADDLSRQISLKQSISTEDYTSPLLSQDSGFQLSDGNDSSGTSDMDALLSTSMTMSPELPSCKKEVLNEVPETDKSTHPKQVPETSISSRINRRNINRIQGSNTSVSSGGKRHLRINRTNLPQSVVKYSSSEDSGADVSMNKDLSPSYTECKSCEALSEKVSSDDSLLRYKPLPDYRHTQFFSLRCKPGFIDSHCHLDFLLGRQNYKGTYTEYMQEHSGTYPASYEGCVAVFCHPNTFHKKDMWQKYLGEKGVWGAFGCHPHHSKFYNSAAEHHLKQAIQHSKVRALGEIGLDYSNRNNCSSATQHQVFRRQLKIAFNEKLPLVIHCRDANEDTMRIMKEILPRDYTIHLHCFTDGWDWAQKWMKEFPNLCIGITNLVTFSTATPTHDVVKRIPLDRLLLETDAPYFIPKKLSKINGIKHSHPGMAIHVAAQIAALRDVSLKEVIHHTRHNTRKIYGI